MWPAMESRRPKLSLLAVSTYDEHTRPSTPKSSSSDTRPSTAHSTTSAAGVSSSAVSSSSNDTSTSSGSHHANETKTSFYKSAHWTHDGTTIITSSYDNRICSFLVPEDLLEPREHPLTLRPHRTLQLATPTNVVATAPYYDIRIPNTDHLMVASQDHPLQLYQTFPPDRSVSEHNAAASGTGSSWEAPIASYHFTSPTTEAYYQIHSLVWPKPGTHFCAGTRDLIAQFDVTRNGNGPSTLMPTIPSRRHIRKGNGVGMRGTVSALSAQPTADDNATGLIAAGTWTRWVGLYDIARSGECTATWSIEGAAESVVHTAPPTDLGLCPAPTERKSSKGVTLSVKGIGGAGINQTVWSPCGRYLLINERQSTGMLVYDVRGSNKVLGFLAGRDARTHQRMSCDVFQGLDNVGGFEVWAGAMDGTVKVWEGVGNTEGCQWPSWDFSAADGAAGGHGVVSPALGSVGLHYSGSVIATCAGSWTLSKDDESSTYQQRDESDGPSDGSPCIPSHLPAGNTLWRSYKGGMEESCLKLWMIGANGSPADLEAFGEPDQLDMQTGEADEIEKHRQRILSALDAKGGDELMDSSALEGQGFGGLQNRDAEITKVHELDQIPSGAESTIQVHELGARAVSISDARGEGEHLDTDVSVDLP